MVLMGELQHTAEENGHCTDRADSGYYTAPTGTGASNPYGYQTTNTSTNY